jgi:hypothetical protein
LLAALTSFPFFALLRGGGGLPASKTTTASACSTIRFRLCCFTRRSGGGIVVAVVRASSCFVSVEEAEFVVTAEATGARDSTPVGPLSNARLPLRRRLLALRRFRFGDSRFRGAGGWVQRDAESGAIIHDGTLCVLVWMECCTASGVS